MDSQYYCDLGFTERTNGNFDQALKYYDKALELDPLNDQAYYFRGVANGKLEKFNEAITDFKSSIRINPDNGVVHYYLGLSYCEIKEFDKAIQAYNKAIILDPEDEYAYYYRGLAKQDIGDIDGACKDWYMAKSLNFSDAEDTITRFCGMEKDIQSIGTLKYIMTIIAGRNRQIKEIKKLDISSDNKDNFVTIPGDYIITIGRRAVIITQNIRNKRVPIIVKSWRRTKDEEFDNFLKSMSAMSGSNVKTCTYRELDGYKWKHYRSDPDELEWLTIHGEEDRVQYEIRL